MVTFQFVPYSEIEHLGSARRVNKLINLVKDNRIVILEGRLQRQEETDLIEITMEEINNKFKGIELSVIYPDQSKQEGLQRVKSDLLNLLLGNRRGLTIIGPSSIVKKIEKNPHHIELLTRENRKKRNHAP